MDNTGLTALIRQTAAQVGFDACGIAPAAILSTEAGRLQRWVEKGYHGKMAFLERSLDKRANPALLVENARSVVLLLIGYKPQQLQPPGAPQVAYFAYGRDYHDWLQAKLRTIIAAVKTHRPEVRIRGFADSAPLFEKAWAARVGLGWIGKNNLLVSPRFGSFVFLASLLTDAGLDCDTPPAMPSCGSCTRCLDACPTQALREPYILDATRCIAYHTIETKEAPAIDTHGYCYGCDCCQRACPWNERTLPHTHTDWTIPEIVRYTAADWQALDEDTFRRVFAASSFRRAGFHKLQLNIAAACNCKPS